MRVHIELVHILQNTVEKGIVYFFWQIIFRGILILTLGCLDNISIFSIRLKLEFLHFTWESIPVGVYTTKQSRKGHCIFCLTEYIQSNFVFNIGVPRYYLDFFCSRKIRISVFYMREHIEFVYILQNRVEKGIVYFLWQIIFREILLLTLGCLDNI